MASNLNEFVTTVRQAYSECKKCGRIPSESVHTFDKLVACPQVVSKGPRRIFAHRRWRAEVARMYYRQHRNIRRVGEPWIDWSSLWEWIKENIVQIIKILLVIVPFII